MSVNLSPLDFQKLTQILQKMPEFANVRDRHRLVSGALEGHPQAGIMLARLDLDGTPLNVAVEVIKFLAKFGQVAFGKEALGILLNYIQPFTNDEDRDFILDLFQRYPLDTPISSARLIDRWFGATKIDDIQEKIIGEDTLRHVYILDLAREAAKAVVHLRVQHEDGQSSLGTGFMINPGLLMTNHHVIRSQQEAKQTEYTFNYQLDPDGKPAETITVQAATNDLFYTNSDLDFTIISLKNLPLFGKPLALKSHQMKRDQRVAIIQHPGGHFKKISMQNNFVAYADSTTLQYLTSTLPGSSGSPIFDEKFEVVGIHHSGGMLAEPGTDRHYLRNAGTSMIAILKDLKINQPEIYLQIENRKNDQ